MKKTLELDIKGMTCTGCAHHITKALRSVPGVEEVSVPGWQTGKARVVLASETVDPDSLARAVDEAGYEVSGWRPVEQPASTLPIGNGRTCENAEFDLVIVGGGSAAFAAALKTSELGGRAVIINDGLPVGGTCVNVGCVPSKALIRAAEAHHRAAHHPFEGIVSRSEVSDFGAVTAQVQALVRGLRQEKYLDVIADDPNIQIMEGRARLVDGRSVEVDSQRISGKNILIATGARTAVPPIDGLDSIAYLTNESAYELEEKPEHLIVLGGGYIALENAQAFARLGSRVTVLELLPRILATEADDVSETLADFLRADGIEIHTGVRSTSVRRDGGEIILETSTNGQSREFRGSHLFVATGRRGNTEGLGLEALGIETTGGGYIQVDDSLRTSVPTVFGAGDVIGSWQFVYTAAYEGQLAAENAQKGFHLHRSYTALPWVVFTDPQVAGVGMDERQAQEAGIAHEVSTLPLFHIPRALATRDTRGFIRLLRNAETDTLIGARVVAAEGSELLMEVALAIKYGIAVREIAGTFHPYLTLSEGIKLAALAFDKDVKKLSCCAA